VPQLVTSKQVDKATAQLEAMKKLAPQDFRTVYSDALVSFARNDPIHARDAVQRILAQQPDNLRALYLSGLVNYQLGSYAAAEEALRRVVALAPSELNAVRVLGLTYLKTGQRAQAVEILEEGLKRAPDDPTLLRTAGEAYLASGNLIKAAQGYERANAIDKGNVASDVRLAQMRFAAGDTSRAFKDLESLSQAEPSQYEADIALITANLRQGAFDKALAAVKTLETKQPNNPLTYNLKGAVYLGLHDHKNARTSFEKALELDPNNFNAAHTLALVDLQERKPEDARKRYESIVAREPKNEDMLLALAELAVITGQGPGDVRAAIERAISANPTSVRSRLALINYYARTGDAKAQLAAADAARAAFPTTHRSSSRSVCTARGRRAGSGNRHVQTGCSTEAAERNGSDAARRRAGRNERLQRGDRVTAQSRGGSARPGSSLGHDGEGLRPVRPPGRRNRRRPQASEGTPGSRPRVCHRS
jgi:putative PEP-CTERM system TPR-repeat lipoprotein